MPQQDFIFSVRADLFRVAQAFADRAAGVLIDPLDGGGVMLIGYNHVDLIAVCDPSGHTSRRANVAVAPAFLNVAVDLFRKGGINVRLHGSGGVAFMEPSSQGQAMRNFERPPFPQDWRALLAPHYVTKFEPPLTFNARWARKCGEAAIGLARAAKVSDDAEANESFELRGGRDCFLATFPAWPDAVALFGEGNRRAGDRSSFWHPPHWAQRIGPQIERAP